ncbi:TPA: IS3 family transposase, partial [Burkholderia vietnamiensis]|nr:IS3 family transposase [Burkholderia vietnamiensis]
MVSKHSLPVAPNLLNRDISVTVANLGRYGDITYIATDSGQLYLADLTDRYSGEVVACAMSERMARNLIMP